MVENLLFKGRPISAGTAEGPVKYLGEGREDFIRDSYGAIGRRDPETLKYDPADLEVLAEIGQGRVVVMHHFTIHYYAEMLYKAAAFILEEESTLSHATALATALARELGIPAVAVEEVSDLNHLEEGMNVKVDGTAGLVSLSESQEQEK